MAETNKDITIAFYKKALLKAASKMPILHSHWHGPSDNPRGEAVVDILRLEGGKVLEHWNVIQPIPETSANANTMF
jgi:predicted SnoaL-like aldol condensation-catalyzing enzyme